MISVLSAAELQELMHDLSGDAGFGALDTKNGCLPLKTLEVDVSINGLIASTKVRQQFANVFDGPLEATYIFPLPPRAAVIGFRMTVNGAVINGRIKERAEARQDYEEAIAEGRTAAIAEEERPDVFTLRVGHIPARALADVEFMLVAPLAIDSLEATYRFPLVVAPRYCPGQPLDGEHVGMGIAADTDTVPDASRISPPVLLPGLPSPVRLTIRARVPASVAGGDRPAAVGRFACSLPADEQVDAFGGRVVTVVPGQRLDRDFVLRWNLAADERAGVTAEIEPDGNRMSGLGSGKATKAAPGDATFSVTVIPPVTQSAQRTPRDVVVLLDRSGSMGGWKMASARRAVARMVDTLTAEDRVAVIAFDDEQEYASEHLMLTPATDRHRWKLLEWLAALEARGGTELAAALAKGVALCEAPLGQADSRQSVTREAFIVLVTDGQVGDEEHVLRTLAAGPSRMRLCLVGIDTAVNEGLLTRLAESRGGLVELVESENRLDEVMDRIQSRIAAPLVTNLSVTGEGIELIPESIVPARLPDLVAGVPLVIRGRCKAGADGLIRVTGQAVGGGSWRMESPVANAAVAGIGSLWARAQLRHLEDAYALADYTETRERLDSEIVGLSTSFGVLCRFTAVVAVDDRHPASVDNRQPQRQIVQPVERPLGFMGMANPLVRVVHCLEPRSWTDDLKGPWARWTDAHWLLHERKAAFQLIGRVKPKSGDPADVSESGIEKLLRGVLALLRKMGKASAPAEMIEKLALAYARLYAWPKDTEVLRAMLNTLAEFAAADTTVDRWWLPTAEVENDQDIPF